MAVISPGGYRPPISEPPPPGSTPIAVEPPPPGSTPVAAEPPPPGSTPEFTGYGSAPPPQAPFTGYGSTTQPEQPFTGYGTTEAPRGPHPDELSQAPVSLVERAASNFWTGVHGASIGSLANLLAEKLSPNTVNIDPNTGRPMPTIHEQMLPFLKEEQAQAENLPSWQDEKTPGARILGGSAALLGSLAGGTFSPEGVLVPGEGGKVSYTIAREGGEQVLRRLGITAAKDAAIQGGTMGVANAGSQLAETFTGTRESIDPYEIAKSTLMGAGMGAGVPLLGYAAGRVVNAFRGGPRVGLRPPEAPPPEAPPAETPPPAAETAPVQEPPPPGSTPVETPDPNMATLVVKPVAEGVETPPVPAVPEPPAPADVPAVPPVPGQGETPPVPVPEPPVPAPAPVEPPPVPAPPEPTSAPPTGRLSVPEPEPPEAVASPSPVAEAPKVIEPPPPGSTPVVEGTTPSDRPRPAGPEQPQGVPGVGAPDAGRVQPEGAARRVGGEGDTGGRAAVDRGGTQGGPEPLRPQVTSEERPAVSPVEGRPAETPGAVPAGQTRGEQYRAAVNELDARKAPDSEYRGVLSTGGKEPLTPGETWRSRVLDYARQADQEARTVSPETVRPKSEEPVSPRPEDTKTPAEPVSQDAAAKETTQPASAPGEKAPPSPAKDILTSSGKRPVSTEEHAALTTEVNKTRKALSDAERKGTATDELRTKAKDAQAALSKAEGPPTKPTGAFGAKNVGPDLTKAHAAAVEEHTNLVHQRVHAEGQDAVPVAHPQGPARLMGGRDAALIHGKDSSGQGWVGNGTTIVRTGTPTVDKAAAAAAKRTTSTTRDVTPGMIDKVTDGAGHDNPITWDRHVTLPEGTEVVVGKTHAGDPIALNKHSYDTLLHAMGDGGRMTTDASRPGKGGTTLEGKVVARNAHGEVVGVAMPLRMNADHAHTFTTGEIRPKPEAKAAQPKRGSPGLQDQIVKRETSLARMEALGAPESKLAEARAQASRLRDQADMPVQHDLRDYAARAPARRTVPPAPITRAQRADYSPGASSYKDVFRDAGHDPELAQHYPIKRQAEIVRQQTQDKFGFKNVTSDQSSIDTRNMLADFYHNAQSMAAATGVPFNAISLDGRLSLALKTIPKGKNAGVLGMYVPSTRTIHLMGRSNSFAHEWTHGWDHYLADELLKNPKAMRLLSETSAIRTLRPGPGTSSTAEAFAHVLGTIYGEHGSKALDILRLQHLTGHKDPVIAAKAATELIKAESDFAKGVREHAAQFGPEAEQYLYRPAEMLARTHEAYVADRIENVGGDTKGVTKPGEAYSAEGPRSISDRFDKLYPKAEDRAHIFEAYDKLHDAQRDESIAAFAGQEGHMPSNADTSMPRYWGAMADVKAAGTKGSILRQEVNGWRRPWQQIKERLGYEPGRPPAPVGPLTRAADVGRALTYTPRALMEQMIHRVPEGRARELFQRISDHFAAPEGIRSEAAASGRLIGQVFEEDVMNNERRNINFYTDALRLHGLEKMTVEQQEIIHQVMTGNAPANLDPNLKGFADKVRDLLMAEYSRHPDEANLHMGFAKNAYFPRVKDNFKIFHDPDGFAKDATEVYKHVYDDKVTTREDMLDAHGKLKDSYKAKIDPDIQTKIDELRKNESRTRVLERERVKLDPADAQDAARIAAIDRELKQRAGTGDALHAEVEPHIREQFATQSADDWANHIVVGNPTDYETKGPASSYSKQRVLPPEADKILAKWYITDPSHAIPEYFRQSARRIAYEKRFGGGKLEDMFKEAAAHHAQAEDIHAMRSYVESLTGRQKSGLPAVLTSGIDKAMAIGTYALMTKAAFTSFGEPMAAIPRIGVKGAIHVYASQIGDILKTASSKERKALANAIGLVTSALYDSTHAHRMGAAYDDFPGLNKLTMNYFRRTGLTAMTNSQSRGAMSAGHIAIGAWARDLLGTNARLKHEAAAQFRELGIPDRDHAALAQFMQDKGRSFPTLEDIDTHGGTLWGQAVRRLSGQIIQNPLKVDKPNMSSNPMGRMMFGLMNFNYAFYHHVVERAFSTYATRFMEAKGIGAKSMVLGRSGMNLGATAAGMYGASMVATLAREALFNGTTFQEHMDKGDLFDWLSDLAIQRTGINGPLDPIIQAINGLKYEKSLTGLTDGAQVGWIFHNVEKMITGFLRSAPHTNTAEYNAIQGAWGAIGVPAAIIALTAIPGGPLTNAAASWAMMATSSKGVSDWIARSLVGPKGSTENIPGKLPPLPGLPALPGLPGEAKADAGGSVGPWGLVDDVAAPAFRLAQRLPGVAKVVGAGAVGIGGLAALLSEFSRYTNPPAKPVK